MPGGYKFHVGTEKWAGLSLEPVATIDFLKSHAVTGEPREAAIPETVELTWFPDRALVALVGDGRYAALFDYDAEGLRERANLRLDRGRIGRALEKRD